jgi:hypothetical protein
VNVGMEFSKIYHRHMSMNITMNEWMFCTVGLGIPPVPGDQILTTVNLINVKLCTYSIICFCIISKKSIRYALRTIYEIIQMNRIVNVKGNRTKHHTCASSNICRMAHPITVCSLASNQNNKACGNDMILNELLKWASVEVLPLFVKIFNIVFTSGI